MSENYPLMEGLEDRCLLSAHGAHMPPPPRHAMVMQATVVPLLQGTVKGGSVWAHNKAGHGYHQRALTTIVTVDTAANTVTVSTADRKGVVTQNTYNVSATATLSIDGVVATLDQFITGVNVKLQFDPADPTTITSMIAVNPQVEGKVTAIDAVAGTITLAGRRGATTTYTVGAGATVTVNGQAGELAGITVGFEADIGLSALDGTTVVSVKADGDLYKRVTVVSVDAVANTITFSQTSRGVTTETTLNVSPAVVITIDGQAGTLDQFVAGVNVSLQTDPKDATSVVTITAVGTHVEGKVTAVDTVAGTITIAGKRGAADTTYTLGKDATVTVNGQAGALAGIGVGFQVKLGLSALDGATVVSIKTEGQQCRLATVVGVDTGANTITVSQTGRDGTVTETTFNVSPSAVITADGQAVTLDQLVAGVQVSLATDPMDVTSVVTITARGVEVCGIVSAVDAAVGTITLTDRSGTATTYAVGATATIKVNGAAGTLDDIEAGFRAELKLSALGDATVVAVDARAVMRRGGWGNQSGNQGALGGPAMRFGMGPSGHRG